MNDEKDKTGEQDVVKQSQLSVASLVISIIALLIFVVVTFLVLGYFHDKFRSNTNSNNSLIYFIGVVLFADLGISITGFGLAITSLLVRGSRKLFTIIAIIINIWLILNFALLFHFIAEKNYFYYYFIGKD